MQRVLCSTNGTFVNGDLVGKGKLKALRPGDVVTFCFAKEEVAVSNSMRVCRGGGRGRQGKGGARKPSGQGIAQWLVDTIPRGPGRMAVGERVDLCGFPFWEMCRRPPLFSSFWWVGGLLMDNVGVVDRPRCLWAEVPCEGLHSLQVSFCVGKAGGRRSSVTPYIQSFNSVFWTALNLDSEGLPRVL